VTAPALVNLEKLLAAGKESALLRFGLGNEHLKAGRAAEAAVHFRRAVELDPDYSAAWKLLGKALTESGRLADALSVYQTGIAVAQRKGDQQAAKEMAVMLRRIEKRIAPPR
jgi:Flp pilus assembly protein TadD